MRTGGLSMMRHGHRPADDSPPGPRDWCAGAMKHRTVLSLCPP